MVLKLGLKVLRITALTVDGCIVSCPPRYR